MAELNYFLYAPTLNPDFDGAMLGRDTLARHPATGQAVVLKSFRQPWRSVITDDQKDVWRQVRHPALVSFLRTEPSLTHGTVYAYHSYQFETLGEAATFLRDSVGFSPAVYIGHFRDIADALANLADMGLSHGAINPESIVVTRVDGRLRIKDFGLSLSIGDDLQRALEILRPALPFIAPEVFDALVHGNEPAPTVAADVYSLGAVMHDFFFGRPPIVADHLSARDVVFKVLGGDLVLAESWREWPILTGIVHRCLHPDPKARYASFAELAHDLGFAAESLLDFVGEDIFGLRFIDARGGEVRVLPDAVTVVPQPAEATANFGCLLPPDWLLESGTRTVARTRLDGLIPLGERDLPLNVWEFHFVQGMTDLASSDTTGGFVVHADAAWFDPRESRVFLLYPGLRPRPGQEAAFAGWLDAVAHTGKPPYVAPEVVHHARALMHGEPVTPFDHISATAARCSAVYALARFFYTGMTRDVPAWDPEATPRELPLAYYREQNLSVQMSEILAACLAPDPTRRTPSAEAVGEDYRRRASKSTKKPADTGPDVAVR